MNASRMTASSLLLLLLGCSVSQAAITVTEVGTPFSASAMPGAANNFIFFDSANYPFNGPVQGNGTSPYVNLTNFTIAGGLQGSGPDAGNSTVTTPAGTSLLTGAIAASTNTFAFALEPVGVTASNYLMYDDFFVYVMYGNTNGKTDDSSLSLEGRSSVDSGGGPYGGVPATVAVTDFATPTTANFLEFEVRGLGTEYHNGDNPDLVLYGAGANGPTGVGGVSFQFAATPEPSTWALIGLGALALSLFAVRRQRADAI